MSTIQELFQQAQLTEAAYADFFGISRDPEELKARSLGKPKAQPNTRQLHGLYHPMLGCAALTQPTTDLIESVVNTFD